MIELIQATFLYVFISIVWGTFIYSTYMLGLFPFNLISKDDSTTKQDNKFIFNECKKCPISGSCDEKILNIKACWFYTSPLQILDSKSDMKEFKSIFSILEELDEAVEERDK